MSKGKKVTLWLLAVALVLSLGLAAAVYAAGPMGMGMGHGPGMMNLTPDQAGKFFDLKEKFRTDTASLRKNLLIKHLEMKPLWKAENPDEKAILAKQKEINALRDQMMEKSVAFRLEARKISPQLAFGRGMGMGHGGGMGMGHGGGMGMGGGCGMGPGGGMGMGPGMAPPAAPAPPAK
jgi:zinc resistance-associated protein